MVTKGQYWAIKNALTTTEKELIGFYELQWLLRHNVPTVEEVVNYLNRKHEKEGKRSTVKITSVNYYLQRKPVIKALDDRGIPWREQARDEITPTQQAAAVTVSNFADTRSIDEKLDQLGILPATYYAWLKDPQFANLVQSLANENLEHIDPVAKTEFTKKIAQGDWNAIKYYMEVTGTLGNDQVPQGAQMVMMIIEVIQRHVKDQNVMAAIAQDLITVTRSNHLVATRPQELTGELVTDSELATARKKLGV